jgi:hypothetical protein
MILPVNKWCRLHTDEHSNARRSPGRVPPPEIEIAVQGLNARLQVAEARSLAKGLNQAIGWADTLIGAVIPAPGAQRKRR